eukprot:1145798-Pelagomonas_calceolata.AAC.7
MQAQGRPCFAPSSQNVTISCAQAPWVGGVFAATLHFFTMHLACVRWQGAEVPVRPQLPDQGQELPEGGVLL